MTVNYEVLVSNIGTVYSGTDKKAALQKYHAYVAESETECGRASNESVTIVANDEIYLEFLNNLPEES